MKIRKHIRRFRFYDVWGGGSGAVDPVIPSKPCP